MRLIFLSLGLLLGYTANAENKKLGLKSSLNKDALNKRTNSSEIKYLNDIVAKASVTDFNDMEKILNQLTFEPSHKDPASGVQLFKVTKVEKGSIFEKAGIKIGDLIANGNSPKN